MDHFSISEVRPRKRASISCCRHLTCLRRFCPLCSQNPHRRCQPDNNFAFKHVESEPLSAACGATIMICLADAQLTDDAQASSAMSAPMAQLSLGQLSSEDIFLEVLTLSQLALLPCLAKNSAQSWSTVLCVFCNLLQHQSLHTAEHSSFEHS